MKKKTSIAIGGVLFLAMACKETDTVKPYGAVTTATSTTTSVPASSLRDDSLSIGGHDRLPVKPQPIDINYPLPNQPIDIVQNPSVLH